MEILLQVLLLIGGFVLLVKGADWFVDGASAVALRLGIPQLIIGLTIVAMGTSLPEAAISISAAAKDSAGIAVGNVLGSNTLNILLILGVTSVICPIPVKRSVTRVELPFLLFVSAVMPLLGAFDGVVGRLDGAILWVLFLVYLGYLFMRAKKGQGSEEDEDAKPISLPRAAAMIVLGAGMIVLGSNVSVDAATVIARTLGLSERLIGLTIVAIGTSLPELVTSVTAALKGKTDIAIGNIVGSNLFNILFVLGTSSLVASIPYDAAFLPDTFISIGSALLLFVLLLRSGSLKRWSGCVLLGAFTLYYVWLFI